MFALFEDVCLRYDVDGIEMDFMRHLPHFKINGEGTDCTQKERNMMTKLLRRIRKMTEKIGMQRNRPILIAVWISASLSCNLACGLAVPTWIEEELFDLLIPGEWEFSPWHKWVELGHKHGVAVYPCLSWTGSKKRKGPPSVQDGLPLRSLRSRVTNIWQAGADGVYLFNIPDGSFKPTNPLWREMGDPKILARLDKDYFPHGYWRVLSGSDIKNQIRFIEVPLPPFPERPITIVPGKECEVVVEIGDDLRTQAAFEPEVTLSVLIDHATQPAVATVGLNGTKLSNGLVEMSWLRFPVSADRLRLGSNIVKVFNHHGADQELVLKDVHLAIDFSGTKIK